MLLRKVALSVFLLSFARITTAQQPPAPPPPAQPPLAHTLLWRISGKGLTAPSYLFGTMHLNDQRLFHFDDSVYRAIERTEGLAIELNPDEMAAYVVNKLFDQVQKGKKLGEVLDQGYLRRHSKALSKKFRKPAEEITTSDVLKEKNKWLSTYMEKGEMPTFVDAYLYNIARRQGKWLGGIEDMGDQAGLMEEPVDRSDLDYLLAGDSSLSPGSGANPLLEKMIDLYSRQDIAGIEAISTENSTTEQKDRLLITRNLKMSRRIDSLTALRTMFLAVGAAHLPGDSGVIRLLQQRGFTLTPVLSTKKIAAKDYTFKEVRLPWIPVTDPQGLYTVSMPGNPAAVKLYGLIEMKFLMDLFNMSGYCTMAILNTGNAGRNKDSLFRALALRVFHNGDLRPERTLENNGAPGREYIQPVEGSNIRLQVFINDNAIYMALVSALKKEVLTSTDADRFFQSFHVNKMIPTATAASYTFSDSTIGISLATPAKMTYNEKLSEGTDSAWKVSCYTAMDLTGSVFMLFSREVKPGYHITDDSVLYDALYGQMKLQYKDLTREDITVRGLRGMKMIGKNDNLSNIYMNATAVVKNNRFLILAIISDDQHIRSPAFEQIFNSLHFLPQPSSGWKTHRTADSAFSVWSPSPLRTEDKTRSEDAQLFAFDTLTATSYFILPTTLDKYSWYKDDSLFWKERTERYSENAILEQKDTRNGDMPGKEVFVKLHQEGNTCNRTRFILSGNTLYQLFLSGDKELLYSDNANKFFDSFRVNGPPPSADRLTRPRTKLLLQDLRSEDQPTRYRAFSALRTVPFGKEDLPLLEAALFGTYRSSYDTTSSIGINNALAGRLAELADPSALRLVKEAYPSFTQGKEDLKKVALALLARIHTTESYTLLGELLRLLPSAGSPGYGYRAGLLDSLALTATIYPSLQQLVKDTAQASFLARISLDLLDSGYIQQADIERIQTDITHLAAVLHPLRDSGVIDEYEIPYFIRFLGRLHTPASLKVLKSFLYEKDNGLAEEALLQWFRRGQLAPASLLHRLAADGKTRHTLYKDLTKLKKTSLFPPEYRTQAWFSEASVYDLVDEEEDGRLLKPVFLSKRTAAYNGEKYLFYLYKATFANDEDSSSYLAITGGYPLTGAALEPAEDLTGLYWKEPYDAGRVGELFKKYLELKKTSHVLHEAFERSHKASPGSSAESSQ